MIVTDGQPGTATDWGTASERGKERERWRDRKGERGRNRDRVKAIVTWVEHRLGLPAMLIH